MNTEQAFQVLVQATAAFNGTRKDHETIAEALNVIREVIKPADVSEDADVKE